MQTLHSKLYFLQDVNDVLTAIDHVINMGLADPSKITVLGGSHGGFLTSHLIGQVGLLFNMITLYHPAVVKYLLSIGCCDL